MNPCHAFRRAIFRAMRHSNFAASLTTAFLVISSFFASSANAAVTQLKIGGGTFNGTADTSGSGWTWIASNQTLIISNNANITGGVNFVTDGAATLVTIISNGTVNITGNISTSSTDAYIQVSSNGSLTLTGSLKGMLTAVSGSTQVIGNVTSDLDIGDGASATITGGVGGDVAVAGGNATITGGVEGDFAILAGSATITGGVDGFVEVASGTVKITGGIGGAAIVVDGNVTIEGGIDYALAVLAGTVNVTGNIDYGMVVLSGSVTVTGTVDGATHVSGGVVKVNGATVTPATFSNASIPLNTLSVGASASGSGWAFDGESLILDTPGYNYTLTGTAAAGINVYVDEVVTGTLTLQNAEIDVSTTAGLSALRIAADGLVVSIKGNVTLAGRTEGILYFGEVAPLILDTAAGSKLTVTGGSNYDGIYCMGAGLVIKGSGTLSFRGGDSVDMEAWAGIYCEYGLIVQGSVQVTAIGGNYTGTNPEFSGDNDGIFCLALSISDSAKVTATGGNSLGAGCFAGSGVIAENGLIRVTSSASLTATAGNGGKQEFGYGTGIGSAYFDCFITGSGQIKATGDYGIATLNNIYITGGNITAQGRGTGYALYAARISYENLMQQGGYVTISGGNVTAKNNDTAGHEYWKHLNHTGGAYNGTSISGGTGGSTSGGGGGGGAPMPIVLVLLATLFAIRARRK